MTKNEESVGYSANQEDRGRCGHVEHVRDMNSRKYISDSSRSLGYNAKESTNNQHSHHRSGSHSQQMPPYRGSSLPRRDSSTRGHSKSRDTPRAIIALDISGSSVVRLRNKKNILSMYRAGSHRNSLSDLEVALHVMGLEPKYMKDPNKHTLSEMNETPGVHKTNLNLPEEKFKMHALRSMAFVSPLPRGFGSSWHLQYSFFTDKTYPLFDDISHAAHVIQSIERAEKHPRFIPNPENTFTTYLIRNVRRMDDQMSYQWMCELASGKRGLQDLIQTYGVPFKQWRPVTNVSRCPLLDFIVKFRPGFIDATWLIRVNVIYTELNEIKRDCIYRLGDWFFHPRRLQRRSQSWTDQLVEYLYNVARQMKKQKMKVESTAKSKSFTAGINPTHTLESNVSHLHGEGQRVSSSATSSVVCSEPTYHEKWSYILKLSEYQLKFGILDPTRFFDGIISLLQKMLSPKKGGICGSEVSLGINESLELIAVVQNVLPEMMKVSECVILLVKTLLHHLRLLLPPGLEVADKMDSPHLEELVSSFCQILRDIILNCTDILVRLDENVPSSWPSFIFTERFFDQDALSNRQIQACILRCLGKCQEVSGRINRLHQSFPSATCIPAMRCEAQVIQSLDRFHRVDTSIDLTRVYNEIFISEASGCLNAIDVEAIFLVCEWAATSHRPAECRYLSAVALLELHSNKLLLANDEKDRAMVLQDALQQFLKFFQPKSVMEFTQLIDLYSILIRRRVFCMESFTKYVDIVCDGSDGQMKPLFMTNSPCFKDVKEMKSPAIMICTAYNMECLPGKGYKSSDIAQLTCAQRLKLYLWQLPRGPYPLPTCLKLDVEELDDPEQTLVTWLSVMDLKQDDLTYSKTMERAQSLCVYVFLAHGESCDLNDNRALKEVEYQGKVSELVSTVKTMSAHDKGRFTAWFLRKLYDDFSFFRFSDLCNVESTARLVCLILEITDVLALLEVLVYFVRNSPPYFMKNVVISMIERHQIAYCAAGQIPFLLQSFVDRFHRIPKDADDKAGTIAKFFCRMYYSHAKKKEIGKLDLPFALLRPIAETARKNQDSTTQKPKELSLEATNPLVRIPPPREAMPQDLKGALSRCFKALQTKFSGYSSPSEKQVITPPSGNSDFSGSSNDTLFQAAAYSTLGWGKIVGESTVSSDIASRDCAVEFAVATINSCMTNNVTTTNTNATRERRTPNYVFFLRAILSEVMDKWMANLSVRAKNNCRRPIMTPHYIHRCVRLIRDVVEQHPEGEDFQEKFSNTLLVWLQKEVLPGFSGTETQKRVRNPFVNIEMGKDSFILNQKGRLDMVQYGLKAFIVSLIIHKVVDLTQVLRLVLVPLFPRLRRGSRDSPPNLPCQLLAMALVFQLFSEPPQNVPLDQQRVVMFDEPLTKYHLRYMRSQVPGSIMFALVHLLCQISYQMEDNFLLRKREERGTLASITLFNLTSDIIVREIIFHDTKEAREKHILPVYHKKQWHTAVLLTHFFRPQNSPAEDLNGQVQLLKVDQIVDQMNVWNLNRGGSIYLDLQMSRQQLKVKKINRVTGRQSKRKQQSELPERRASKRGSNYFSEQRKTLLDNEHSHKHTASSYMERSAVKNSDIEEDNFLKPNDIISSDEEDFNLEFDDSSSATEILSNLIVLRVLNRSSRPPYLASATLSSISPVTTPLFCCNHLYEISKRSNVVSDVVADDAVGREEEVPLKMKDVNELANRHPKYDSALASLYAATICSISRRAVGSVIAKILQVMEEDVNYLCKQKFERKFSGTAIIRLICGIMCTQPGGAFLPRYMMSLAVQMECLYEACTLYDKEPSSFSLVFLRRLRRKLAVRLQLIAVVIQNKNASVTVCYRDRIVKAMFALLSRSVVAGDVGQGLFSWILDLIPLVNVSVLQEKQQELVASLQLPEHLIARVKTVLPKASITAKPLSVDTKDDIILLPNQIDPWGLLENVPHLPSNSSTVKMSSKRLKTRRIFRNVL